MQKLVGNPDFTWTQVGAYICSGVEVNIGVVCCSLVVLKPFAQRHIPRLVSLSSNRGGTTTRIRSKTLFAMFGKKHKGRIRELNSIDGHGFTQYGGEAKDFRSTVASVIETTTDVMGEDAPRRKGVKDGESTKHMIRSDEYAC
jgi:hypothetical protein